MPLILLDCERGYFTYRQRLGKQQGARRKTRERVGNIFPLCSPRSWCEMPNLTAKAPLGGSSTEEIRKNLLENDFPGPRSIKLHFLLRQRHKFGLPAGFPDLNRTGFCVILVVPIPALS